MKINLLQYIKQHFDENDTKMLSYDTILIGEVRIRSLKEEEHYIVEAGTSKYKFSPTKIYKMSDNDKLYHDMNYSESKAADIHHALFLIYCQVILERSEEFNKKHIKTHRIPVIILSCLIAIGSFTFMPRTQKREKQNKTPKEEKVDTTRDTTILYREAIFPAVRNGR